MSNPQRRRPPMSERVGVLLDGERWVTMREAADLIGVNLARVYVLVSETRDREKRRRLRTRLHANRLHVALVDLKAYREWRDDWNRLHGQSRSSRLVAR